MGSIRLKRGLYTVCSIPGCGKQHFALTYCRTHHARFKRHGDPSVVLNEARPAAVRFFESIMVGDECWDWVGPKNGDGYGVLTVGTKAFGDIHTELAHRFSFEMFAGPIPDGANVLHNCDRPCCTRPDHLFSGTQAANIADMISKNRAWFQGGVA